MLAERIDVYNHLKDDRRALYEYQYRTEKDYKSEFEWLKEVDSVALQQSNKDLISAYSNFFKSLSGKRNGKSGFPKFHKKGQKESYRTQNNNNVIRIDFLNQKVHLPKLGDVKFKDGRSSFPGKIKNATISKTKTGKYFVSLLYEYDREIKQFDLEAALDKGLFIKGLDMSLEHFYVDECGRSPEYVRLYKKYEDRIAYLQKKVSKKKKGSSNRRKAQLRVNKIHEKIANSRKDFVEKLSTSLIRENDVIVIESLNMQNMAQVLKLGKSVNDLGWGMFVSRLNQKAIDSGKSIIQADKWFASSKTCSTCGYINNDLQLGDREWVCPKCNTHHLRDMNAGINLREYGLNKLLARLEQPGVPLEMSASVESKKEGFQPSYGG